MKDLGSLLADGIEVGASYVTKEFSWGKLEFDSNAAYVYNYALKQLEVEANGFAHFLVTDLTDTTTIGNNAAPGPDFQIVSSVVFSKHLFCNYLFLTGHTL